MKRALVEFNFSSIPTGSLITGVQLKLTLGMAAGGGTTKTATIGLFDVLDSWGKAPSAIQAHKPRNRNRR